MKCMFIFKRNLFEAQAFLKLMHKLYAESLQVDDLQGVIDISGELANAYACLGDEEMMRKWYDEHLQNIGEALLRCNSPDQNAEDPESDTNMGKEDWR